MDYSPWFFPKKWLKNHPKFLLHFQIHIDVLMLCRSLSWFRLKFFELWPFLKMSQFLKKSMDYSPCFFPKNGSKITQNFYYIFRYILMSLCYVESLSWFRLKFFELWPFLKMSQFLKKSMDYSPCFFPKNGSKITQNFYYIFRYILMSLCYVESLSWFQLKFFKLWAFFKSSKFSEKSMDYSPLSLAKFCQNWNGRNSSFYHIFTCFYVNFLGIYR